MILLHYFLVCVLCLVTSVCYIMLSINECQYSEQWVGSPFHP